MTTDANDTKKLFLSFSRKKFSAPQHTAIQELKKKYETNAFTAQEILRASPQLSALKIMKKSKVKQMVSMYNSRIAQIIRRDSHACNYSNLANELPRKAKSETKNCVSNSLPTPKIRVKKEKASRSKSKSKAQQKNMLFASEDNFDNLTVKQRAQFFTQFISGVSKDNPKVDRHAEIMEVPVDREKGEVVHEKQASVKHLLEELENRCAFPRQTICPKALQRLSSAKKGTTKSIFPANRPVKSKEFEDIIKNTQSHISTLNVTLQPLNAQDEKERRARSLPHCKIKHEQIFKEFETIKPCHKRSNAQMLKSSVPIEAYAPPKKIRRTRAEQLASRIHFQNLQLENLFFSWLSERRLNEEEVIVKATREEDDIIDKLLEETIAKLRNLQFEEKEVNAMAAKGIHTKPQNMNKLAPHNKQPAPTISNGKPLESEESESSLSSLLKLASDESQVDGREKESDNSEKFVDLTQAIKPLRKKKLRRFLLWKKDEQTHPINSTDSDTDQKLAEIAARYEMLSLETESNEVSKAESAYQTAISAIASTWRKKPTRCQENDIKDLDYSESANHETSHSWHSLIGEQVDHNVNWNNKVPFGVESKINPRSCTDSFIDQGFETGSNDAISPERAPKISNCNRQDADKVLASGPHFIKSSPESQPAKTERENPASFSTPIKGYTKKPANFGNTSSHQQMFSPITLPLKSRRKSTYEAESGRNSLAMQIIREDQPLENHEITSPLDSNSTEPIVFAGASTPEMSTELSDKTSQFWIKSGDFSVSLDIIYNNPKRLRLLYEIFSQNSCDNKDLHFGIDNLKFSVQCLYDQENRLKRLNANKQRSHYWFSTGDLVIPFSGKLLSADQIKRLFEFVKASVKESGILRFGVDAVEFSNVSEFWNQSPKFSMDSTYSMLVGLQSGNSNGLEGRSKFAWPNSKPARVSDLDQTDYECEDFTGNDSRRLSFSPFSTNHFNLAGLSTEELSVQRNSTAMMYSAPFGVEYENESLDHFFGKAQQERLSSMPGKPSRYKDTGNRSSTDLGEPKRTAEYLNKLKSTVAKISKKGINNGFKDCTVEQLKSYMFILSLYADICVHSCSDHMEKLLDALLDQTAVVV